MLAHLHPSPHISTTRLGPHPRLPSPAHDVLVPPSPRRPSQRPPELPRPESSWTQPTDGRTDRRRMLAGERGSTACRPTARHSSRDNHTRRRGALAEVRSLRFVADGGRRRPVSLWHVALLFGCAPPWRNGPEVMDGRTGSAVESASEGMSLTGVMAQGKILFSFSLAGRDSERQDMVCMS